MKESKTNASAKPKILFLGISQELIDSIVEGKFINAILLAIIINDSNNQGRVIHYPGGMLFTVKPEEFPKFNFDFVVVSGNSEEINVLVNSLINANVNVKKIKIFDRGNLLNINMQQTQILPPMSMAVRPKVFIDVSRITQSDFKTGIQRTIRNVYRNLDDLTGHKISSMQINQNGITTARKFESYLYDKEFDFKEYHIEFEPNDKLMFLDTIWSAEQYQYLATLIHSKNLTAYHFIYDLVPILYPQYHGQGVLSFFENCIKIILQTHSAVICISKSVADDVINYYNKQQFHRENPLEVYYFHLSFEMDNKIDDDVRPFIKDFVSRAKTFLTVGTIEIRKNHISILKAFKKIIEQHPEENMQLLIIGRLGWMVEEFVEMISNDESLRDRVLWLQDASDSELHWAYQNSEALILASIAEGFGLPLVEAAHFGLPIICSDIPIFREVTDGNAIYFPPLDVDKLSEILLNWNSLKQTVDSSKIRLYTWKECSQEILDIVDGKVEPYKILE